MEFKTKNKKQPTSDEQRAWRPSSSRERQSKRRGRRLRDFPEQKKPRCNCQPSSKQSPGCPWTKSAEPFRTKRNQRQKNGVHIRGLLLHAGSAAHGGAHLFRHLACEWNTRSARSCRRLGRRASGADGRNEGEESETPGANVRGPGTMMRFGLFWCGMFAGVLLPSKQETVRLDCATVWRLNDALAAR